MLGLAVILALVIPLSLLALNRMGPDHPAMAMLMIIVPIFIGIFLLACFVRLKKQRP